MRAIDLFAGCGGMTTGAKRAGVEVVWAANHWPEAVRWHAANHEDVEHVCQDLHQAVWSRVPRHELLIAAPECQGHSDARGTNKPHHDESRSTAWAVVSCAEFHRPEVVVVENVPAFRRWVLWPAWRLAMQALGYALQELVIDAADHGVPQNRSRLFVVANRGIAPLRLELPRVAHVPARSFVDFSSGSWTAVRRPGRAPNTIARVEHGRRTHGDRFLVPYYGNTRGGRSLDRPIGTITTRDRWGVIDGDRMRMLTVREGSDAMGFPPGYRLPDDPKIAMHLLGNAVCPAAVGDLFTAVRAAVGDA